MGPQVHDLSQLLPIASLALGALGVLAAEVPFFVTGERGAKGELRRGYLSGILPAWISTASLGAAVIFAWQGVDDGGVLDSHRAMLRFDAFSNLGSVIVGASALLCSWIASSQLGRLRAGPGEVQALLLLSTAGMFSLIAASDLITVYLGFELMSLPLHALVALDDRGGKGAGLGLRSVVTSAFASAILLYGMSMLYGATGHTDFAAIASSSGSSTPLALAGFGAIVAGVACKLGAVPFHQWVPELREGAPGSVSAFVLVTASAALLVMLVRVLALQPEHAAPRMREALAAMGIASALMGSAMALVQVQPKRILACLSISHVGFALIALATGSSLGNAALAFSLLVFVFANVGAFAVLVALSRDGEPCRSVDDLSGLFNRRSGLAAALSLFLLTLSGAPGTGGFVAKFSVVIAALDAGHMPLAMATVVGSLLGVVACLRVVLAMLVGAEEAVPEELRPVDESEDEPTQEMSSLDLGILSLCAAAVIATGVAPPWSAFADAAQQLEPVVELLPAAQDPDVALSPGDVELVE